MTEPLKTAVITGVSTGIGRAIAKSLVDAGWRVFGSVRKDADARATKDALGENFTPLLFDVTDAAGISAGAETVAAALSGRTLDALVNNAGVAVAGPLGYIPIEEIERQFDINVLGPIRVTQAFLPLLGTDHSRAGERGRIVNISSVAGKIASPFMAPYAMSKHALEAMSDSLRRELLTHGIDVVIVGPGAIRTPIWSKADEIDVDRYRKTEYADVLTRMAPMMKEIGDAGLEASDVGELVLHILTVGEPKTRYPILRHMFSMWTAPNLMPKRMLDRVIAKRFGMTPRSR